MAEPTLMQLKTSMFQEIPTTSALKILDGRTLGFSQVRLLPKTKGVRPIINLRRRVTKSRNGKSVLGRSINSVLLPVFNVLQYAKNAEPTSVGSALGSVGDLYSKLRAFQHRIKKSNASNSRFFFAKCDVQACFDRLPQRRSIAVAKQLLQDDEYNICRHAEIRALESLQYDAMTKLQTGCVRKKFTSIAHTVVDFENFGKAIEKGVAMNKRDTVFVDGISQFRHQKDKLLSLLEEHVEGNMLKIGKRFYRQKRGIPQGSVLSSLLCDLVYAKFESEYFNFLRDEESILLRLVDDFLLITTNKNHATLFLQIMHAGIEEYGVHVNPAKSISSFEATVNGNRIALAKQRFPYCGTLINTRSLEITKDRQRRKERGLGFHVSK